MVKVTIFDDSSDPQSESDKADIEENALPLEGEEHKEMMLEVKEVVIPKSIVDKLAKDGIDVDQLVAMILGEAKH